MKILVINGPNLNMLGIREPELYGRETYSDLLAKIRKHAEETGTEVFFFQSNHEGALVDAIQAAYGVQDGIVMNPGAYTHTSVALLDALKAVGIPTVEVHITDVDEREPVRKISCVRASCVKTLSGRGTDGYLEAMDYLAETLKAKRADAPGGTDAGRD